MIYLFIQTWIWLLLAAAVGLFVGWLIWRKGAVADCSSIQSQLDECKRRCAQLESQIVDSPEQDSPSEAQTLVSDTASKVQSEDSQEGGKPVFLSQPEGEPDDLKRISGVGPVLEKTLNELGIFHFRQIAGFTKENIDWVNNYLSFSGRIEREDWVGQAKKLAAAEDT